MPKGVMKLKLGAVDGMSKKKLFAWLFEAARDTNSAKNAMLWKPLGDQGANRSLGSAVAFGHGIEALRLLVHHVSADAKARQGLRLGGIGELIEKGAVGEHDDLTKQERWERQ